MKKKNLHDLFDKLGIEKVTEFAEYDDKNVNLGGEMVLHIFSVYAHEKNIDAITVKLTTEQLTDLFNHFKISAGLYVNIHKGLLKLTGRIALTNDKGTFKMTNKGTNFVLNM